MLFFIGIISNLSFSQQGSFETEEVAISKFIDGTLLTPTIDGAVLAIIIADSGPIDRDGNQDFQKSGTLKKLAIALSNDGISTFRYDKRIVKQIRKGNFNSNIKFDDFVSDAKDIISYFKNKKRYQKIVIIGHGQGSLVGMLASKDMADSFISIAGSGKTIDALILEQVELTAPMFTEDTKRIITTLQNGKTTNQYPKALGSMFDLSVQPFMMSWMAHDPIKIIEALKIPVLIINGTNDFQVTSEETQKLKDAAQNAEIKFINNMNHVLFEIENDDQENAKSYNDSSRSISQELVSSIITFIKNK